MTESSSINNPAKDPVEPFDMVVFGGTGDLALRKLLPSLYHCDAERRLPEHGRIICVARSDLTTDAYREQVHEACQRFAPAAISEKGWPAFGQRIEYLRLDATAADDYRALAQKLVEYPGAKARVFYLATSPGLFGTISHHLSQAGLVEAGARVVLEKPIGHDLASSREINAHVGAVFAEQQIYRIDHYLGKETVQNLLVLRFGNAIFEPLWRAGLVEHVQITVAEQVGVEGRGDYYDHAGALRDMVQNHLLQLLCIVAMEPPTSLDPDSVRDEKLKVLRALRPIAGQEVTANTVRGQYKAGASAGGPVPGYLEEPDIPADSTTETFVAARLFVDNWRWAGVPFYLRTGKRLHTRKSEIVLNLKAVPHSIFPNDARALEDNRLVIRLQPEEGVKLYMMAKVPGPGMKLKPVHLNLDFGETFKGRLPDAYERLLIDVIRGRPTLFMRRDEVDAAWRWVEPLLEAWQESGDAPRGYIAGTWGPTQAIALIERDGYTWHDDL